MFKTMKYFFYWMVIVMIVSPDNASSKILDTHLNVDSIAPDLYVVVHAYPWPSNSLCAKMENGEILLVDVPYTPDATQTLLKWINTTFGDRKITAINTHFHVDRLGGNAALVKHDIPIYGSDLTIKAIKERGATSLKLITSWVTDESIKKYYQHFTYRAPTKIFEAEKGLTLNFGSEKVHIRFLGAGHSFDNLAVFLPGKKALFGGCMILSAEATKIGNVSDGDPLQWLETLPRIDTTDVEYVIPGYGNCGGVELIGHTLSVLKRGVRRKD